MSDLDKLKHLLFGAEKEALDSIAERVERPEMRASDVADVLPEALHQSYDQGDELVDAMTAPVGECLQQAFRDDPETYSEALYPVMGPAIRKSISHALKNLSQQINQAVEHSMTPKGLGWRLQAMRAGIPFGQFVLQKTLLYRVEQAYLISRENGLLIEHVHHIESKIKDSDAVSAMFTAIQDFVKESFSPDRTGRLESADMGEFTLWAVHGPHALLVCVIRGVPPTSLRAQLSAVLERIHFRYGDAIRDYKGDSGSVPEAAKELEKCLEFQALQEPSAKKSPMPLPLLLLLFAGAAWLGYAVFKGWNGDRELVRLRSALDTTPGIFVTEATRNGEEFSVRGLRDPLATPVAAVMDEIGVAAERVTTDFRDTYSLEPEILESRIANIVQNERIEYELSGGTVVLSGSATDRWLRDSTIRLESLIGVDAVNVDSVTNLDVAALQRTVEEKNGEKFMFFQGTSFADGEEARLRAFARDVNSLQAQAGVLSRSVVVNVAGSSDGTGAAAANVRLARDRASRVSVLLAEFGVLVREVSATGQAGRPATGEPALDERFAVVQLSLIDQP